jgi:hypothetical protein
LHALREAGRRLRRMVSRVAAKAQGHALAHHEAICDRLQVESDGLDIGLARVSERLMRREGRRAYRPNSKSIAEPRFARSSGRFADPGHRVCQRFVPVNQHNYVPVQNQLPAWLDRAPCLIERITIRRPGRGPVHLPDWW